MTSDETPLLFRQTLAEAFMDAELHGLGQFLPGFVATPGHEDQAATFVGSRCEHLSNRWND